MEHISNEKLQRLVKKKILSQLDFTSLNVCVGCIKKKKAKHIKKRAIRSKKFIEIIYTDICEPFSIKSFGGEFFLI